MKSASASPSVSLFKRLFYVFWVRGGKLWPPSQIYMVIWVIYYCLIWRAIRLSLSVLIIPLPYWKLLVPVFFGSWWCSHLWPAAQMMTGLLGDRKEHWDLSATGTENESDPGSLVRYLFLVSVLTSCTFQGICLFHLSCHIYWCTVIHNSSYFIMCIGSVIILLYNLWLWVISFP